MKYGQSAAWILGRTFVILLVSGLAGATLVRISPGYGLGDQALDPRFSARSLEAIESANTGERNLLKFYVLFLKDVVKGDLGGSVVFGRPVRELVAERAPATLHSVGIGLTLGWTAALLLAISAALTHRKVVVVASTTLSGSLLSVPSAVLATVCLLLDLPPGIAIAAVVFPRVFPYAYGQIRAGVGAPHVIMARAKGLSPARVFLFHVLPAGLMPLLALAGVSVTLAFGASIPIEALADVAGLGQLAWRAALGRDIQVLVTVTLLLTAVTVVANTLSDILIARFGRRTV